MRRISYILLFLLVAVSSGCKLDVDSEPKKLLYYRSYSEPIVEIQIEKNDELHNYIIQILSENKSGWRPSFTYYAPKVLVYSKDSIYELNILPKLLVIGYWDAKNKRTVLVSKKVSEAVYDGIIKIIENQVKNQSFDIGGDGNLTTNTPPSLDAKGFKSSNY